MKLFNKKNFSSLIPPARLRLRANSLVGGHLSSRRGFTLIELLIVIAILGILAAGILVAVDPVDKINQANDSKVQNDVSGIGRASEAYATTHNGFYPNDSGTLVNTGELKRVPLPPAGYFPVNYAWQDIPPGCTSGQTCTAAAITGQLKSKRFTSPNTPWWRYETSSGKSCAVATVTTPCP